MSWCLRAGTGLSSSSALVIERDDDENGDDKWSRASRYSGYLIGISPRIPGNPDCFSSWFSSFSPDTCYDIAFK